jgi:hypothetical protein
MTVHYETQPTFMLFTNHEGQVCFEAADVHIDQENLVLDKCFLHSYPRKQPELIQDLKLDLDDIRYIARIIRKNEEGYKQFYGDEY